MRNTRIQIAKTCKLLSLAVIAMLLCGCNAEVNIEITKNAIIESSNIDFFSFDYKNEEDLSKMLRTYIPAYDDVSIIDADPDVAESGVSYYRSSKTPTTDGYRYTYSYNYPLGSYLGARSVRLGFDKTNFVVDNKNHKINISTSSRMLAFNNYPDLKNVTVTIKTAYDVINSNADFVEGNKYIWVFNRNGNSKNIEMEIDTGRDSGIPSVTSTTAGKLSDYATVKTTTKNNGSGNNNTSSNNGSGYNNGTTQTTTKPFIIGDNPNVVITTNNSGLNDNTSGTNSSNNGNSSTNKNHNSTDDQEVNEDKSEFYSIIKYVFIFIGIAIGIFIVYSLFKFIRING